jgi:glutaconate CoA-transferase subunit B
VGGVGVEDLMAVALAREVADDDFVSHGSGVPLAGAALLLARALHAPGVEFFYDGAITPAARSLDELGSGSAALRGASGFMSQAQIIDFELRGGCDLQFLRPAQIDSRGNVNVSLIGSLRKPRRRFHGIAVADAMTVVRRVCLYATEHTPRVFVDRLDFRTGVGHTEDDAWRSSLRVPGGGPSKVITPLATMDFGGPGRTLRLVSLMPGATVEQVRQGTGCALAIPASVAAFAAPSEAELTALGAVDPHRSRGLEFPALRAAARDRLARAAAGSLRQDSTDGPA